MQPCYGSWYHCCCSLDKQQCNHVMALGTMFLVSPPLGQLADLHCCSKGLQEFFVDEETPLDLTITEGAATQSVTVKEFLQLGLEYLKRNFPGDKEVIRFVPEWMISDSLTAKVASLFASILESHNGFRAVLANLDIRKYFQYVKKQIKLTSTYGNRILVFDQHNACILNVRVASNTAACNEIIRKEKLAISISRTINCSPSTVRICTNLPSSYFSILPV